MVVVFNFLRRLKNQRLGAGSIEPPAPSVYEGKVSHFPLPIRDGVHDLAPKSYWLGPA